MQRLPDGWSGIRAGRKLRSVTLASYRSGIALVLTMLTMPSLFWLTRSAPRTDESSHAAPPPVRSQASCNAAARTHAAVACNALLGCGTSAARLRTAAIVKKKFQCAPYSSMGTSYPLAVVLTNLPRPIIISGRLPFSACPRRRLAPLCSAVKLRASRLTRPVSEEAGCQQRGRPWDPSWL